ncbi:MAG TPA: PEP-CTERM sorting domain-containing protein [Candidatus Sulfopaludibacter sp.]|nr:PEP-CTERM sorting domain-containing protein [Candidatus Sulfopaludibacter sp.]
MKRIFSTALSIGAVCLLSHGAHATLLFSEAFNYTAGQTLGGQINPGNSTAWSSGNAGMTIAAGDLTYAGLADQGGNELQLANGSAGTIYNTFANQTSGQVYYSFLFDPTAADSANNYFTAMNPGTSTPNGGSDAIDAYYYSSGKIELRANAQAATAGSGPVLTLNTTYLIVEMIDLTAKTASLWVDPDASTFGTLTPPTATATLSGITATAIDDVGFKTQSSAGGPYLIDNLLIGTTWADVTPAGVPEPSVLALAGLGIFGLISSVRRRMQR